MFIMCVFFYCSVPPHKHQWKLKWKIFRRKTFVVCPIGDDFGFGSFRTLGWILSNIFDKQTNTHSQTHNWWMEFANMVAFVVLSFRFNVWWTEQWRARARSLAYKHYWIIAPRNLMLDTLVDVSLSISLPHLTVLRFPFSLCPRSRQNVLAQCAGQVKQRTGGYIMYTKNLYTKRFFFAIALCTIRFFPIFKIFPVNTKCIRCLCFVTKHLVSCTVRSVLSL